MEGKERKTKMKRMIFGIVALMLLASFYGCNTMKGLGNDLSAVGGWITRGSEHVEESVGKNPPGSRMEK
jgi:predicted small secreted protein